MGKKPRTTFNENGESIVRRRKNYSNVLQTHNTGSTSSHAHSVSDAQMPLASTSDQPPHVACVGCSPGAPIPDQARTLKKVEFPHKSSKSKATTPESYVTNSPPKRIRSEERCTPAMEDTSLHPYAACGSPSAQSAIARAAASPPFPKSPRTDREEVNSTTSESTEDGDEEGDDVLDDGRKVDLSFRLDVQTLPRRINPYAMTPAQNRDKRPSRIRVNLKRRREKVEKMCGAHGPNHVWTSEEDALIMAKGSQTWTSFRTTIGNYTIASIQSRRKVLLMRGLGTISRGRRWNISEDEEILKGNFDVEGRSRGACLDRVHKLRKIARAVGHM